MNRRGFLKGILAAGVAPFVVTTAGVLMPVRQRIVTAPAWVGVDLAAPMTATEVLARREAWLRETQLRYADLLVNPPLMQNPSTGLFYAFMPSDRKWFTLEVEK